jgi:phage terminase large subunit-like protein
VYEYEMHAVCNLLFGSSWYSTSVCEGAVRHTREVIINAWVSLHARERKIRGRLHASARRADWGVGYAQI